MSQKTPIITCVEGRYQPQAPNTFVCAPAVALIFSNTGEVEVFSKNQKCSQKIVDFPSFGGQGRSIDLLDEQLVLLGDNQLGGKFRYKSIHQPRKGLLGMKYSEEVSPVGNSPLWHTSHSYGNQLLAIGGDFESKAKLSTTVWKGPNLHWKNGTRFSRFSSAACKVKLDKDMFLVIGGFERVKESKVEMNTVLRMNITEEIVEELPPLKEKRAYHACEVFKQVVLIAGGTLGGNIVADEIYNLTTNYSEVLNMSSSLRRQKHALQRIEETIFGLGGAHRNGSETSTIEWFDWADRKWKQHDQSLLSKNTTNLAIVPFPLSAVDCHAGCTCGIGGNPGKNRIVGGQDVQVTAYLSLVILRFFVLRKMPTLGLQP